MRFKLNKIIPIALLSISLFIVGCDEKKGVSTQTDITPTSQESTISPQDTPSENTSEQPSENTNSETQQSDNNNAKINAYVACYNGITRSVNTSTERYFEWVTNLKTGPTGKEKYIRGILAIDKYAVSTCTSEVPAALALSPILNPIDSYAQPFMDSIVTLSDLSTQLQRYYDQKNYEDDNFAKGKKLHPELMAAYVEYTKYSNLLSDSIQEYNDLQSKQLLIKIEKKEGKSLNYYSLAIITEAKSINKMLENDEFHAEEILNATEKLQTMSDELALVIEEKRKTSDRPRGAYSFMVSDSNKYITAVKQRVRRIKNKTPYSDFEKNKLGTNSEWLIEGSQGKVIEHYNAIVNDYNRM